MSSIFRVKPVEKIIEESKAEGGDHLQRVLKLPGLVALGIGITLGAGVFVLTGNVAATCAGPGVIISFVIAALACMIIGLAYAEFASFLPVSGSCYTYGYAIMGEIVAFVLGVCCIFEFMMGAAAITTGWSGYLYSFIQDHFGACSPRFFNIPGVEYVLWNDRWVVLDSVREQLVETGTSLMNLPHMVSSGNYVGLALIVVWSLILIRGVELTAKFNSAMVVLKLSLVLVFLGIVGTYIFGHVDLALKNWANFIPQNTGVFGEFGWSGIFKGAAIIFFAYLGFDSVPTASQESVNPVRDVPRAIVISLSVCAFAYISVSALMTATVPYTQLDISDPAALAIDVTGVYWGKLFIKGGLTLGLAGGVLALMMSISRVIFSIACDGLLPVSFSRIHHRFRTPWVATIVAAIPVAALTTFFSLGEMSEIGALSALLSFVIVCVSVIIMHRRYPDRPGSFRAPGSRYMPILGMIIALGMIFSLSPYTLVRFAVVLGIGLVFYFSYSVRHSRLANESVSGEEGLTE